MDERDLLVILYDIYGDLFNDKQKEYFEEYYFNNLSLKEISENLNVSRNAVSKCLSNMSSKLFFYEDKLKLLEKNRKINDIILDIDDENIKNKIREVI